MDEKMREAIAMFRYGVIGSLISGELLHGEQRKRIRELSRRRYTIPGSNRTHIGPGTIREWLRAFRAGRFEALKPKGRNDRGNSRRMRPELAEELLRLKIDHPRMAVKSMFRELFARDRMTPNEVAPATVYRYFARNLPRHLPSKTGNEQRRFAHRYPNDCWQGDVMHGHSIDDPAFPKPHKTFLVAFIDDASRLIVGAEFFFSEISANVKDIFRNALLTYGIPARLYLDNGTNFRCDEMKIACATVGCALIHTTPYYPEGKGKIERFFRTVRSCFLPCLKKVSSLIELNQAFDAWLQNLYNRAPHRALDGDTPLDTFLRNAENRIRYLPAHIDPAHIFCVKISRRVAKNATFTIEKILYQTQEHLIGERIVLLYDRHDPRQKVRVYHEDQYVHTTWPVDMNANALARRRPLPGRKP